MADNNFLRTSNNIFLKNSDTFLFEPILYGYNQQCFDGNFTTATNWVQQSGQSRIAANNKLLITMTAEGAWINFQQNSSINSWISGHKYLILFNYIGSSNVTYTNISLGFSVLNNWSSIQSGINLKLLGTTISTFSMATLSVYNTYGDIITANVSSNTARFCLNVYAGWNSGAGTYNLWQIGDSGQGDSFNIIDLTEWFGAGNEPTTIQEFKNKFTKNYYSYQATPIQLTQAQINLTK